MCLVSTHAFKPNALGLSHTLSNPFLLPSRHSAHLIIPVITMRAATTFALLAQALAVQSIRIVQSNDDGWAELYARSFNQALKSSGHNVLLSAPAENKSGSGTFPSSVILT